MYLPLETASLCHAATPWTIQRGVYPTELAHKIIDTLNPANDQHARYFDFDPRTTTLQQVKDFLYKVDRKERMKARARRCMQGSSPRNGGNRANRGYTNGRNGQGEPGKRPFVKRITAGRYRQIKRRRDEGRSQRSELRRGQRNTNGRFPGFPWPWRPLVYPRLENKFTLWILV